MAHTLSENKNSTYYLNLLKEKHLNPSNIEDKYEQWFSKNQKEVTDFHKKQKDSKLKAISKLDKNKKLLQEIRDKYLNKDKKASDSDIESLSETLDIPYDEVKSTFNLWLSLPPEDKEKTNKQITKEIKDHTVEFYKFKGALSKFEKKSPALENDNLYSKHIIDFFVLRQLNQNTSIKQDKVKTILFNTPPFNPILSIQPNLCEETIHFHKLGEIHNNIMQHILPKLYIEKILVNWKSSQQTDISKDPTIGKNIDKLIHITKPFLIENHKYFIKYMEKHENLHYFDQFILNLIIYMAYNDNLKSNINPDMLSRIQSLDIIKNNPMTKGSLSRSRDFIDEILSSPLNTTDIITDKIMEAYEQTTAKNDFAILYSIIYNVIPHNIDLLSPFFLKDKSPQEVEERMSALAVSILLYDQAHNPDFPLGNKVKNILPDKLRSIIKDINMNKESLEILLLSPLQRESHLFIASKIDTSQIGTSLLEKGILEKMKTLYLNIERSKDEKNISVMDIFIPIVISSITNTSHGDHIGGYHYMEYIKKSCKLFKNVEKHEHFEYCIKTLAIELINNYNNPSEKPNYANLNKIIEDLSQKYVTDMTITQTTDNQPDILDNIDISQYEIQDPYIKQHIDNILQEILRTPLYLREKAMDLPPCTTSATNTMKELSGEVGSVTEECEEQLAAFDI